MLSRVIFSDLKGTWTEWDKILIQLLLPLRCALWYLCFGIWRMYYCAHALAHTEKLIENQVWSVRWLHGEWKSLVIAAAAVQRMTIKLNREIKNEKSKIRKEQIFVRTQRTMLFERIGCNQTVCARVLAAAVIQCDVFCNSVSTTLCVFMVALNFLASQSVCN